MSMPEILHWTLWSQLSRAYTIEENVSLSSKQPLPTQRTQERAGLQESCLDLRCSSVEGLNLCGCCANSHGCTESLTTRHAWAFLMVHLSSSYILPEPSSQCLLSHRGEGIYVHLRTEHWGHSRKVCVQRFGRLLSLGISYGPLQTTAFFNWKWEVLNCGYKHKYFKGSLIPIPFSK